jgi:flavin-dependent dehydrogenase
MIELAVIGGGPAGLIAAREAARAGASVIVFEEHMEIGEPERCAGLLSLSGLKRLGFSVSGKYLQNIIRGAVIRTSNGRWRILDAADLSRLSLAEASSTRRLRSRRSMLEQK